MSEAASKPPYHEIINGIVSSIMAAQADVLAATSLTNPQVADAIINRHFAWLVLAYPEGTNRHLFDSVEGSYPIRTRALRAPAKLPPIIRDLLRRQLPLPINGDDLPSEVAKFLLEKKVLQQRPTRISRLIKAAFFEVAAGIRSKLQEHEEDAREEFDDAQVLLKSPLSIALDFLTVPEMPGSRAYAMLSVRNYLFEVYGTYPSGLVTAPSENTFTVADIEEAVSHIWTSFRPRYWSSGEDKLPSEGKYRADGLLRQFLAAKGLLWLRFKERADYEKYRAAGGLRDRRTRGELSRLEFSRSTFLDRLPELGEIVNELWGLPVPIRGAETLFRGGLKFSSRGGLVLGIHGGPGSGKTSLALALGAFLAPFEITTLFLTAEETPSDLEAKAEALLPDDIRRLSFCPPSIRDWLKIQPIAIEAGAGLERDVLASLEVALARLRDVLNLPPAEVEELSSTPKPCRAVIVLDGIHDLLMSAQNESDIGNSSPLLAQLRKFVVACRDLRALVVLTAREDWAGDTTLDYLVDVAMRLSHNSVEEKEYGKKPHRQIILTKARHQLCAVGTHGIQIAGAKGVRFSPQINYQLERQSVWRTRVPDTGVTKPVFQRVLPYKDFLAYARTSADGKVPASLPFRYTDGVRLFRGSNIFLNGEGSGSKAALALKLAISPSFDADGVQEETAEKVLVVSFLYPKEYYEGELKKLIGYRRLEYGIGGRVLRPTIEVIHLYPGYYRPDFLFNRIEWELDAAELHGSPYTAILVEGIHNVYLQFPEIEHYRLFWPQLYAALRRRPITIITTHTTLVLHGAEAHGEYRLDDGRSEPLRQALVQKTDFRFEIDSATVDDAGRVRRSAAAGSSNLFSVRTMSAINQPIPANLLLWSRDKLILVEPGQPSLI